MKPEIKSRLPEVGTSIFALMTALAEKHSALNLSQGFPDFQPPAELIELVYHHLQAGHNQYAPMPGVPALRRAIASKTTAYCGHQPDPETEINVTAGATEALFSAITAVVHPGDEVILFDPAYDSYVPVIRLCGGHPVRLQLKPPGWRVDWNEVADCITPRTRLIIINTPHNPTGSVFTEEDWNNLAQLLRNSDILVLSDEVYEHIIFDGLRHHGVLENPELAQRAFSISSFGKTYHATGWKVGYCIAPADMMKEFRRVHQYVNYCVNTPLQHAMAEYLANSAHYEQLPQFYQQKRDLFCELLQSSRFSVTPAAGTYFQLLGYSDITDEGDQDYAHRLTMEAGIASIPVSFFNEDSSDQKLLRFCFAKDDENIKRGAEILCQI